jgi:hypothetical protein
MKYIVGMVVVNLLMGAGWMLLTYCLLKWRHYHTGNCPICGLRDRLRGLGEDP